MRQYFQKNKAVTGKIQFFVIGPFCTLHSSCLNIGFWRGSFVSKWCVFNLVLSTKRRYSQFSFFRKSISNLHHWKRSKLPVVVGQKHADLWTRRLFWKSIVLFFRRRTYALSARFRIKSVTKSVSKKTFDKNQLKFCRWRC